MQNIKVVIFDLDGTLANTLPMCIAAFRKSVEPLTGNKVTDAEIVATFGPSEEGTIMALAPDHYDKGVASYLNYYEELHDMCPEPFEGIRELLELLKSRGVKLAMVTGKGKRSAEISMSRFGISHYFEKTETGDPKGPRKVDGIRNCLEYFGNPDSEEVIYVGDSPSDIGSCREAGIPIAAAAWAETAEPEALKAGAPDVLFYKVSEFFDWLEPRTIR
ncbi:pyrophosphatase PpaX [Sinomicrobium oceani]|uniref:phosphoglycolate phosphatase n=1 Tax=Sinomicrobium oceani TaxID=1150368 RepID=A0A1K1RIU7_9FLAO|nr:HAD family hydrolase [Sinomicrobium oceani]SFW71723.1 pyrophosphatase PpaX [Sinomicrobium oceani]